MENTFSITKCFLLIVITLGIGNYSLVFSQTENEIIAVVDGKNITQADVESYIPSLHLAFNQQQLYALRKVALENYIIRILLVDEASRRGISVESLIESMTLEKVEVSINTVEQEYLKNVRYFGSMSPDEAKERLRIDFEGEARMQLYLKAISKLKSKAKIEILLTEPQPTFKNASIKEYPSKGSENAKITIIEFSDFRCPHCKNSQQTIKKLLSEYKGDIRLVYKHLPIETNKQGLTPSIAANCANSQGYFWEFHDRLFNSDNLSINTINTIAIDTGLDIPKFKACLASDISRFAVLSDLKEAKELGITSTPTFIINGKIYVGRRNYNAFKSIIERELLFVSKKVKEEE